MERIDLGALLFPRLSISRARGFIGGHGSQGAGTYSTGKVAKTMAHLFAFLFMILVNGFRYPSCGYGTSHRIVMAMV